MDPDDLGGISRDDEGADHLIPSRLIGQLRSDKEIANAILVNCHWTALRLDITGRRIAGNRTLTEVIRRQVAR